MAIATPPLWTNGPSIDAEGLRRCQAMFLMKDGTSARGARSGVRPGSGALNTTVSGSTISVAVGTAAIDGPTGEGVYVVTNPTTWTGTLQAADATNPRIDLVYARVWDNALDGSGLEEWDIVYLPGTASSTPTAPSIPSGYIAMPLAQITVPQSGGGSPSVDTSVLPVTVGPGGILPSSSAPTAGLYVGQFYDDGTQLRRWNGTVWETYGPVQALPAGVAYTPTWAGLSALGGSTAWGRYIKNGTLCTVWAGLDWGSGSSLGTGYITVTLPVAAAAGPGGAYASVGTGRYVDGTGSTWKSLVSYAAGGSSTATVFAYRPSDDGWLNPGNIPYTWGSGAHMQIQLTYETAS